LRIKIKELQTGDIFFGIDDKEIIQAQIRIGDLIGARQKLLNVERQSREEEQRATLRLKVGRKRRASELVEERRVEQEKTDLKREAEEDRLSKTLARQALVDLTARDRLQADLQRDRDGAQARLSLILEMNQTEDEQIETRRLKQLDIIQKDFNDRLILEKDYRKAKEEIQKKSDSAIAKLEKTAAEEKQADLKSTFGTIAGLTRSGNKTLFRIGQAAAIANATIDIAAGITKALSLGPILGPVLAGLVAAAGAVQIGVIASTSPPSARQQGGQFQVGQRLLVGEQGPELVEFGTGGRIADTRETARITGDGSSVPEIIIINQTSEEIQEPDVNIDTDQRIIILIRNTVSSDFENPNSRISKSLGRVTTTARRF